MNNNIETPDFDCEAIVRQHVGSTALALFNQAQRQRENAEALYTAALKYFNSANKDMPYHVRLYKDEMRECGFYKGLERYRRRLEDRGDEIAMESRDYVDFLTMMVLKAMPDTDSELDALNCAYWEYSKKLANAMQANLDAGSITGDSADRARKVIRHNLGPSAVTN